MENIWNTDLSIHNEELDKQHQIIFNITQRADEVINAIKNSPNNTAHTEELKAIVMDLFKYVKIHFKAEEKHMESLRHPFLAQHQEKHKELLEKTKNILKYIDDSELLARELSTLTKGWILDHFALYDSWIYYCDKKLYHLNEVHYYLQTYIKIKSLMHKDIFTQESFHYICNCPLRVHKVPKVIHYEIQEEEKLICCEECKNYLVSLEDSNIENIEFFDYTI